MEDRLLEDGAAPVDDHRADEVPSSGSGASRTCWGLSPRRLVAVLLMTVAALALVIVLGFWVPHYVDQRVNAKISSYVVLTPEAMRTNSEGWQMFAEGDSSSSVPILYQITVFHVNNSLDVLEKGAKPVLIPKGPYIYRQILVRFNCTFHPSPLFDNVPPYSPNPPLRDSLSCATWRYYVFERNLTDPSLQEDDMFTTVNLAFQAVKAALDVGNYEVDLYGLYKDTPELQRLFANLTVKEAAFGFHFNLSVPIIRDVTVFFPGIIGNTSSKDAVPPGWVDTVYTGSDDISLLRRFYKWRGRADVQVPVSLIDSTLVPAWGTPQANAVTGTDAFQFPPNVPDSQNQPIFIQQLSRELTLVPKETIHFKGVKMLQFEVDQNQLLNSTAVPNNANYYSFGPYGLFNITKATGASVFVSKPHFLDADPRLLEAVIGLSPNRSIHDIVVGVEPQTGLTMHARSCSQTNFLVQPISFPKHPSHPWFEKLPADGIFFPVLWNAETGDVTDDKASDIRSQLYWAQEVALYASIAGYVSGALVAIIALILAIRWQQHAVGGYSKTTDDVASDAGCVTAGTVRAKLRQDARTAFSRHVAIVAAADMATGDSGDDHSEPRSNAGVYSNGAQHSTAMRAPVG